MERLFGRTLKQNGCCWVKCSNGISWKLDLGDPCHRWIVFGKYEGGAGIDLAASVLENGGVYIDSGANIGQWLLYLGHFPSLKILAFEPVSSQRTWLKECVSVQDHWTVDIFEAGLGSQNARLNIQTDGARSTLQMDWYKEKNHALEKIDIRPLDSVLEELDIEAIDFWKLDTEGAELEALLGAKNILQQRRIRYIHFECHPSNYADILALLKSCGYGVFDLLGHKLLVKTDTSIPSTQDLIAIPI